MSREVREIDITAGYAVKKIKTSFDITTPEELLIWKVLERAILDLAIDKHKFNAAEWLRDHSWPCVFAGVDEVWVIEQVVMYGLWPKGIAQNAKNS